MRTWSVYILKCDDGSLYTGATTDLDRRLKQHNAGTASKYTRSKIPCELVWSHSGYSESKAKKEEARIKKYSRKEKLLLIASPIKKSPKG